MIGKCFSCTHPVLTPSPPPRAAVVRGRVDHPCVLFIQAVFDRCIRLGVYDDFVDEIPSEFSSIIPPEPVFQFKYDEESESEFLLATGSHGYR